MTEAPSSTQATPVIGRNPGPRPALTRRDDDDTVISARPRTDTAAADALEAPSARPSGTTRGKTKAKGRNHGQAKAKDREGPRDTQPAAREDRHPPKKPKDAAKHKSKDKAVDPRSSPEAAAGRDDKALVVSLPKPVRKALTHAASEHGTTPERLVALVISEWLDH